ncbi:MAG: hypothetical protein HQ508_08410 [Candidatus Marinimicrobia bacterium]|nr:hypothetical protein [Candidatus Neomarinimicrobiota bacterium]
MANSNSTLSAFIKELRNRRVFRVAAVYLGVGYAILESSSIIIPMLGWDEVIPKVILGILVIGFPLALIVAWMFQMTPDGLRRSPKSGEKQTSGEKPLTSNAAIVVLLMIIVGLLTYQSFSQGSSGQTRGESKTELDPKSVAVLPFIPFNKTEEDQSFADGVHDDILTQLSKIAALKVISRTSVMQYQGTTIPIPEIAQALGVENILEGSVRRAGDKIRIVAQLINARTDEHLWAETYDRSYTDIFAIQSDVAQKIAKALKATLTHDEKQYIETKPTENHEAWDNYIRAELLFGGRVLPRDSVLTLYDQATRLDPNFLLPYGKLTRGHAQAYFDGTGADPRPERLEMATIALNKMLELNPDAPETHLAQGYYYYYGSRDYSRALEEFSMAQQSQPNNSDLFSATAFVKRRLGLWDEALENLEKAVALDPKSPLKVEEMRDMAFQMRKWDISLRYQTQLSAIHGENDPDVEIGQFFIELGRSGNPERLKNIINQLVEKFGPSDLQQILFMNYSLQGDFVSALELIEADTNKNWLDRAYLLNQIGEHDKALKYYDSLQIEAEDLIKKNPDNWHAYGDAGIALAQLGHFEEAIQMGQQGIALMPLSRDGILGVQALEKMADIYVYCNHPDQAIDLYDQVLSKPGYLSVNFLKLLPMYDSLRELPRFQALIQRYSDQSG